MILGHLQNQLSKEQIKKIGLVTIDAEYLGTAGDVRCYEAIKVSE